MSEHESSYVSGKAKTLKECEEYAQSMEGALRYLSLRDFPSIRRAHFGDRVDRRLRTLDYGCGPGTVTKYLQDEDLDVVAVDIDAAMVKTASAAAPKARCLQVTPGKALPFADGSFDIVFSSWVVLELPDTDALGQYLAEAFRILSAGGLFYLITDHERVLQRDGWAVYEHPEGLRDALPELGEMYKVVMTGPPPYTFSSRYWTQDAYCDMLKKVGFDPKVEQPLGKDGEKFIWKREKEESPLCILLGTKKQ